MATSRKKQDEKNLKILRELGALPQNKYCFDCNQRGPTYVNVTIGSFVCTKCSGILRGLTPPHRVKSISMATFTSDEVELLRNRGNEYCRRVWLGLYEDTAPPTYNGDEQAIRDLMVDKYERKRFYLDYKPDVNNARTNTNNATIAIQRPLLINNRITNSINTVPKNNNIERTRPELPHRNGTTMDFVADFDKADIFSSSNNNVMSSEQRNGFANFDNNPVFTNNAGMPPTTTFNNVNAWSQQTIPPPPPPAEDKYAALKDLDNELKSQTAIDWSSNGSLYSSPTPTGSVYSSPSPQNSVFGSPSQGQFMSAFASQENGVNVSNPFSNGGVNWCNGQQQPFANPFQDAIKTNGFSANFKTAFPINGANTNAWTPNPFKVGATTNSTNPFL